MIPRHITRLIAISILMFFAVSAIALRSPQEKKYSSKELDELMVKVLQNCKTNLENLRSYFFSETEMIDTQDSHLMIALQKHDPSSFKKIPIHARIDYIWTLIDGYLIPSPTRINGKEVSVEVKKGTEEEWFNRKGSIVSWDTPAFDEKEWFNRRQNHPPWYTLETIPDFLMIVYRDISTNVGIPALNMNREDTGMRVLRSLRDITLLK
jgi:hypothetical protein